MSQDATAQKLHTPLTRTGLIVIPSIVAMDIGYRKAGVGIQSVYTQTNT